LTAVEAGVPYIQSLTRLDARGKCVRRMAVNDQNAVVPVGQVERSILLVRGVKVMLDCDLARLYGTATKAFNQAVKRNSDRFPPDFMFQLTHREKDEVVTNCDHLLRLKFSPALPYAFTEHGAIMAASVLNTRRAIEASVFVVRAFVKLREMLAAHKELALKLTELEQRIRGHDQQIQAIVEAIRRLMAPPERPPGPIGVRVKERPAVYRAGRRGKHG
jgi:hypothetical protein